MPRRDAAFTSMVLTPAPARTISDKVVSASIGSVTFVLRTIRTSGRLAVSASASCRSASDGSYTTSHPAATIESMPLCSNWSAMRTFIEVGCTHAAHLEVDLQVDLDQMRQQSIPKLRLEPGRLGRHDAAGIAHLHQVVHADGVQRERHRILARPDQLFELRGASRAADEVDSLIAPHITDAELWREHVLLQATDIETVRCAQIRGRLTEIDRQPSAVEEHCHVSLPCRRRRSFFHRKLVTQLREEGRRRVRAEIFHHAV